MRRSFFTYGLIAFLLLPALTFGAQHQTQPVQCSQCHSCTKPTTANPCLRSCPRAREAASEIDKGPETVVLNTLEREYEPVIFNHKVHAEMSAMDVGCGDCHHFSSIGNITACYTCHPPLVSEENIRQPGLRGAYHRQCMGCHQDWSGDTSCEMCHVKKSGDTPYAALPSGTGFRRYGSVDAPVTKVWESTYGGGTKVTLHHRAHNEKYGIDCASCHHAEGCKSCHKANGNGAGTKAMKVRHSEEALHAICNQCHAEMSCRQCHLKYEATEFSHDRTGWSLGSRHERLACRSCHGNPNHFTKPSRRCNDCHSRWTTANFLHTRTGLALNEIHREFDCTDCHVDRDFAATPSCSNCHGADITYPGKIPGTLVNRKS